MTFPHGLRALNHAAFRSFFLAQLVALVGAWMQTVSQAWLVLQLTNDSPFKLGLLGTLQFGPILLLSPFAGVIADRWPRRHLLIAAQVALACQAWALALLVATGRARYWQIALLSLVTGLAHALDAPARQSFVMGLVGREDLVNAIALNSASFNTARIVGPAVAGVLIARFGVVPAFVVNGVGFAVVLVTLLGLPDDPSRRAGGTSMRHDFAEGLRYAARTPRVRILLGLLFAVSLCVFNFVVYVPLLARTVLHLGPEGFGFLMAALGVGAVAGALALGARANSEPRIGLLLGAGAVACVALLGLSAVRHVWTAVPLLVVTGFTGIVTVTGCNTTLQLAAPDALRGRVMSLYTWIFGGVFPIGAFLVGAISERYGVSEAFLFTGSLGLGMLGLLAVTQPWRDPVGAACAPAAPPGRPRA